MSRPFHAKSRIVDSDYDSDATEDDVNQSILESQSSTNFEKVADDQELWELLKNSSSQFYKVFIIKTYFMIFSTKEVE